MTSKFQEVDKKYDANEPPTLSLRFQFLATALVLACALCGASLGAILSEEETSQVLISWLALPGDLFIRALKCVVLPLVFVTIMLAVIQMAEAGKAATVGKYTVLLYIASTTMASIEGLIIALIFQKYYTSGAVDTDDTFVNIKCPDKTSILSQEATGVKCQSISDISNNRSIEFEIIDINEYFQNNLEVFETLTFSETLQENIFKKLVPENIAKEFSDFSFIGVLSFSIMFGIAAQAITRPPRILLGLLNETNDILMQIINWIIFVTPFAVFSLVAGALAPQENLGDILKDIGVLVGSTVIGFMSHLLIVWPLAFYYLTKTNPFVYMKFLLPAQFFGFAVASSAATLPVNMRSVKASNMVPDSIRNFVLPIGTTINMDGSAIYFPGAILYMANSLNLETGIAEYILIIIVSTIGSAGVAPVVNGSILVLLSSYITVYGGIVPPTFGILFGIQWLIDRFIVVVNISGDALVARVVTVLSQSDTSFS